MNDVQMKQMIFGPEKFETTVKGRQEGGQAWASAEEARMQGQPENFGETVAPADSNAAMERGYRKLSDKEGGDENFLVCGF